jgi:hypothetical protein
VGWPLSALLEAEVGWRGACFAWAGLHLVLGPPLHRYLNPAAAPTSERVVPPADGPREHRAEACAAPRYAMALLAVAFVSTALAAHPPCLLEGFGAAPAAAVAAGALIGPALVGARLLEFGFLSRFHPLVSTLGTGAFGGRVSGV